MLGAPARLFSVLAAVLLAKGCGDGDSPIGPPPPEPARPATVTVTPATVELTALGAAVQLTAEVRDQLGRPMTGQGLAWASGTPSVATVDSLGLVRSVGNGTTTITARAGPASGSAAVTVAQAPDSVAVSPSAATITALGDTLRLAAEAFDANGHRIERAEFGWSSSDVSVARVDGTGLVTGVSDGTAAITAVTGSARGGAEITVENPDRAALVALYNATDGPNWVNSENWLTDARLGEWYGVDTDASGRVVTLDLSGEWDPEIREGIPHGLSGVIPPELGDLANLRQLDLGYNRLSGPIPPQLGDLSELRALGLQESGLTGPIPPELGKLHNLRRLNMRFLPKAGVIPPDFGNLVNLELLWLAAGSVTGPIPPELGKLKSLIDMELYSNRLTGPIPPELGSLANLRRLQLRYNRLSGPIPPELGSMSGLEELSLQFNRLGGPVPSELGKPTRLKSFAVHNNRNLVGQLPTTLVELGLLTRLTFHETGLCAPQTTAFQSWLRGLEQVQGENCQVVEGGDREALAAIYEWTGGDGWLNSDNWLSDGPLDGWYGVTADATDRVTALDLSNNQLAGILPVEAGNLLYLQELALYGNSALAGELPGSVLRLTSLSTLRLGGTELCSSQASVFQAWLASIADARVAACQDDHGNDRAGATKAPVGGRVEGELESYADEDWFRVELVGRGAVTVQSDGETEVLGELYSGDGTLIGYDGAYRDGRNFVITNQVTPGAYYVRIAGETEDVRGGYTLVSSFAVRAPAAPVYLTQVSQSHDFAVPLVAGEDALLRVFVMADSGVTAPMPPVRATFHNGRAETHSVWIDASSAQVPHGMAEGDLDATANAVVPGSVLVPGTEMVIEVDPDGTLDASLGIGGRIPEEGRTALDIRAMPDFHVTAVPFLWAENPDSSGFKAVVGLTADHEVFYETRDWLPVASMEVAVRDAVLVDYDPKEEMGRMLQDVALLRVADGASGYYMGVPPWKERGVLGIAKVGGRHSVSRFDGHTIAHEFGHNFSLDHAPCGRPGGVDGGYPHAGGVIGTWGYDFRGGTLVDPELHTDLMTYCRRHDWISDYSFKKALEHRASSPSAGVAAAERILVLRGGVVRGRLSLEPAFVLDAPPVWPEANGPYRLVGRDARGGELFALRFDMEEIADAPTEAEGDFTFAIPARPEWADALATIALTGPEGIVTLTRDDPTSATPTTLVLDAATGRIQAIWRDPPPAAQAERETAARSADPGLEVLTSRGIPDAEAWRR